MKSFIEVIKEADETQAKLKFIQDPKSSSKSIANLKRSEDPVVRNAAEEELKRRRDSGDQDAAAHVDPIKDASIHTAQTQVGGEQAQAQEKETKTKEVEPNRIAPFKKGSGKDILNNLKKGKTISGDAPNAIELNPQYIIRADGIKEAAMKSVVFSFGRMNPPTVGHEKLVDKIQAVAKANKADARLFLSRTEGDDKNPLPYSDKLKLAKMAFPGIVQDTPKSMYPAGFIGLLKMLEDKYDKVIIVVGSDRLANIKSLANKYNGSEYKFEEIEVVSAGERDPDEEGVGGMSASKMRAAAKAGDLAKFKSGLPSRLKSAAKLVMDKLKQYLSEDLDEAVLTTSQRLKRRAVMRRFKGKIRMGQRRALRRKANTKVISRRSKRIAIKMMRKRILRGRKYSEISLSARQAVDRQVARRKTVIGRIAKRIEPKLRRAEASRRSGQGYKSISLGPVKKKKLKEGMSRDNLIQSVNAIMKRIIAEQNYSLAPLEQASLIRKSNETGVPVKVIKEVYARGVASWNMGLREDTSPQQWGFARVNSFLAGGFNAYTADRDLAEETEEELLKRIPREEDRNSLGQLETHGRSEEVRKAAAERLKELDRAQPAAQPAAEPVAQSSAQSQGGVDAVRAGSKEQPQDAGQAAATVDLKPASMTGTASSLEVATSVVQNNSQNNQQSQNYDDLARKGDVGAMDKAISKTSEADFIDKESETDVKNPTPRAVAAPQRKETPQHEQRLTARDSAAETIRESIGSAKTLEDRHEISKKITANYAENQAEYTDIAGLKKIPDDRTDLKEKFGSFANLERHRKKLDAQASKYKTLHKSLGYGNPPLTDDYLNKQREDYTVGESDLSLSGESHLKALKQSQKLSSEILTRDSSDDQKDSEYKVPGNITSALGENQSGVGQSYAIENNLDLSNPDDLVKMSCHMINSNFKGKQLPEGSLLHRLGQEGDQNKIDPPPDVKTNEIREYIDVMKSKCPNAKSLTNAQMTIMYTHTMMAVAKTAQTKRDMDTLGWDSSDVESYTFAGTKKELNAQIKALTEYKKDGGTYVVTGDGKKLDIDRAILLASNMGGGENSADTSIIIRNKKTGDLYFRQTSDKSNPSDQTGNTTIRAKHEAAKEDLEARLIAGNITQEEHDAGLKHIESEQEFLKKSIADLTYSRYNSAHNLLAHVKKHGTTDVIKVLKTLSTSKKDSDKYLKAFIKYHDSVFKEQKGESDANKLQRSLEHISSELKKGNAEKLGLSADLQTAITRLNVVSGDKSPWRGYTNVPKVYDSVEEDKKHIANIVHSEERLETNLNSTKPNLGSEMTLLEKLERSHLLPSVKGSLSSSGNPQAYNAWSLTLGHMTPTKEDFAECGGFSNMKELLKNAGSEKTKIVPKGTYATRDLVVKGKHVATDVIGEKDDETAEREKLIQIIQDKFRTKGDPTQWGSVMELSKDFRNCLSKKYPRPRFSKQQNESFLSFADFLEESADKAVGNVPVINAKPIHHKASSHKYHIHHMMDPNVGLKHQVKDFSKRLDKDVDSDIDQFDKPSSKLPDEVSVPTKKSTAQFFAKYKKEREHIHAGEPVDESSHQYTGNEDSWYIDASGQKVQVMHTSDLKNPEDVAKYLKDKNPDDNIGKVMSMKDFLKTQPEKKK